jgi:hypothetical protein
MRFNFEKPIIDPETGDAITPEQLIERMDADIAGQQNAVQEILSKIPMHVIEELGVSIANKKPRNIIDALVQASMLLTLMNHMQEDSRVRLKEYRENQAKQTGTNN